MLQMMPYMEFDGIRTFTDSQILGFYDQMVKDGTIAQMTFEGVFLNPNDFLAEMKSRSSHLYVAMEDNIPVALIWVNHIEMAAARVHFCFFSNSWGHAQEIMKFAQDYLADIYGVLLGYLPSCNTRAVQACLRMGLTVLGKVPDLIWDHANQKRVEGTIVYYRKNEDENLHND